MVHHKTKLHWKYLASAVDIHGLNQVTNARSTTRALWITMLCVAVVVLVINIAVAVDQFLNNPLLTTFSIQPEQQLVFPKLYICPLNFLNKTVVNFNKYTNERIDGMLADYYRTFVPTDPQDNQKGGSILARKTSAMQQIGRILGKQIRTFNPINDIDTNDPAAANKTFVNARFDGETITGFFKRVGYETGEFVKECSFAGKYFNCADYVRPVFDFDYGKCWILDLAGMRQTDSGSGLSLLLDIWTEQYPEEVRRTGMFEGVVMKIGNSIDPTSVDKLLLEPGHFTTIRLASKTFKSINVSIGQAQQSCSGNDRRLNLLNLAYSRQSCQFDCLQQSLQSHCNCILPTDPYFLLNQSEPLCAARNKSLCTAVFLDQSGKDDAENFTNDDQNDDQNDVKSGLRRCLRACHKACSITEISSTATSAIFPSQTYQMGLYVEKPLPAYNPHHTGYNSYDYNQQHYYYYNYDVEFQNLFDNDTEESNRTSSNISTTTSSEPTKLTTQPTTTTTFTTTTTTITAAKTTITTPGKPPTAPTVPENKATTSTPYYHPRYDSFTWRNNYILVDVAFGNMHLEILEQSPSVTLNMFVSNLGGQLGLWIGASLFTVIQFCAFVFSCCCPGGKPTDGVEPTEPYVSSDFDYEKWIGGSQQHRRDSRI